MQNVYLETYTSVQFYFTTFHVSIFANYRQQIPFLSQKLLRNFWLQVPFSYNSRMFVVWKRVQCTCFLRWIVYIQCEWLYSCSVEDIFCGFSLMKHMLLIISNTFFTITISTLWKRLDVCSIIYILLQMSPLKTHNHYMKKYFSSFNNYCTPKTKESQSYVSIPNCVWPHSELIGYFL